MRVEHVYDMGVLSGLLDVVAETDVRADGTSIADAIRARDLLDAKIAAAVGEYDAQGLAALDGAHSTIGFLKQCGDVHASTTVKIARRMRQLPVIAAAWQRGDLTTGHVKVIVANVDDDTIDQLAEHEADLVPTLEPLSVTDAAQVMRLWKAQADALVKDTPPTEGERTLRHHKLLDGRSTLSAELDAESTAIVDAALRLAASPDGAGEERTPAQRRGDAFVDVFRFFLDHQDQKPKNRNRGHLNVVVDWDRMQAGHGGALVGGAPLSPATIRRVLCDSDVHRVVTTGGSVILDYGTTTRLYSDAQFNAIVLRDQHCRHFGCDRPPQWCQVHHTIPVEDGGPTDLATGILKCTRHHHIGHLPGWAEKLEPDGTYHLTAPDGRTWTTHAPGVAPRIFG